MRTLTRMVSMMALLVGLTARAADQVPPELLRAEPVLEAAEAEAMPGRKIPPGRTATFVRMMLDEQGTRETLAKVPGALFCFWLEGFDVTLDVLWKVLEQQGGSEVIQRALIRERWHLAQLRSQRCGGPPGGAAARGWQALESRLEALAGPGGYVHRTGLVNVLAKSGEALGRCTEYGCAPTREEAPPLRLGLVAAAALVLGLIPVPDEVVTWPVLMRLAGATP